MIPRLGDGNQNWIQSPDNDRVKSLEIDSPSRGRKLNYEAEAYILPHTISLEIDSPSRGRKLGQDELDLVEIKNNSLEIDSPSRGRKLNAIADESIPHRLEIDSPSRGRKLHESII